MAPEKSAAAAEEGNASASAPLLSDDKEKSAVSLWSLLGPGLLVCLADTDAGCLVVAAQSGASWAYSLVLLQILLVPILYFAQQLTVRLGIYTKMGHAACIKLKFGSACAWATSILLCLECVLTIISEMSGIAAVMQLWGFTRLVGTLVAAFTIISAVVFCKYRQIEVIGITLGLFELTFVVTMLAYHPPLVDVLKGLATFHFGEAEYLELMTANLGAVLMPFMIYFQQSAVVARRLKPADIAAESTSTFLGSCLTQLVMISTVITYAASRSKSLESIQDMHLALVPVLGDNTARVLISLALIGGSLCAAFVVSLAASWALCDCAGWDDTSSVDRMPFEAPRFYAIFFSVISIGVFALQTGVHVVTLNVWIELVNGLLMPAAVCFLYVMSCSDLLPPEARVTGQYKVLLGVLFSICAITSLVAGVKGIFLGGLVIDVDKWPGLPKALDYPQM